MNLKVEIYHTLFFRVKLDIYLVYYEREGGGEEDKSREKESEIERGNIIFSYERKKK